MNESEGYPVKVYDSTGNRKVTVYLLSGDEVEWKKNGVRGCFRARVLGWKSKLRVEVLSHDGQTLDPRLKKSISGSHIVHAFRKGIRLQPEV